MRVEEGVGSRLISPCRAIRSVTSCCKTVLVVVVLYPGTAGGGSGGGRKRGDHALESL